MLMSIEGEKLVVALTSGKLGALDASDGKLAWETAFGGGGGGRGGRGGPPGGGFGGGQRGGQRGEGGATRGEREAEKKAEGRTNLTPQRRKTVQPRSAPAEVNSQAASDEVADQARSRWPRRRRRRRPKLQRIDASR